MKNFLIFIILLLTIPIWFIGWAKRGFTFKKKGVK